MRRFISLGNAYRISERVNWLRVARLSLSLSSSAFASCHLRCPLTLRTNTPFRHFVVDVVMGERIKKEKRAADGVERFKGRRREEGRPRLVVVDSAVANNNNNALGTSTLLGQIYSMRHDVYAAELRQHKENGSSLLRDKLDLFNIYVAAVDSHRGEVLGFVAVTPPMNRPYDPAGSAYSIDKYVKREELPFDFDNGLFEVRILTMKKDSRGGLVGPSLMFAAFRFIEERGGTRIMVIGRREVAHMYERTGLKPLGSYVSGKPAVIRSGDVTYQVMTATVEDMRRIADGPTASFIYDLMDSATCWDDFPVTMQRHADMSAPPSVCGEKKDASANVSKGAFHGGAAWNHFGSDLRDTRRRRSGVVNADVLDAPFDPSPQVLEALGYENNVSHASWLLRTSPPTHCEGMVKAISIARGVDEDCILCGSGSSSLMFLALPKLLTASSRVAMLDPTYGEYRHICERIVGCSVAAIDCDVALDCIADADALEGALTSGAYDLVVIVNPNSPTGQLVPRHRLETLLRSRSSRTRVWVDETYIEYAQVHANFDDPDGPIGHPATYSLETFAASNDGVFVCKSMSKMYALSGARAAYLVGTASRIAHLKMYSPPWSVSLIGQSAAIHALRPASYQYYLDAWAAVVHERKWMHRQLRERFPEIHIVGGACASFLLIFLPESAPTAAAVVSQCALRGIYLRNACGMGARMGSRAIRIAIKSRRDNERVLAAMKNAMQTPLVQSQHQQSRM